MILKALSAVLFFITLACVSASVSNAQTTPDQNEKTTRQQQDDDDERDEKVSRKERGQVRITISQARKIALERVSGEIVEEELEKENGRIVYSIEIRDAGQKVFDVEVDAKTGEIVNIEEEIDDDEDNGEAAKKQKPARTKISKKKDN